MLVDDALLFEEASIPSPAATPGYRSISVPSRGKDMTRVERSLQQLHALAHVPFELEPEPVLRVRDPGPIWRQTNPPGPRMSKHARAQLLQRINSAAPEETLERLRHAARQPGMTGIAAWRQMREHERTLQRSHTLPSVGRDVTVILGAGRAVAAPFSTPSGDSPPMGKIDFLAGGDCSQNCTSD